MVDLQVREERILKIKVFGVLGAISVGIILIINLLVIPSVASVCNFNEKDYKGSDFDKAGISIEQATKSCKMNIEIFKYFSLIFLIVPIITYIFIIGSGKVDKEHKIWFTNYNGKCGRCSSTVEYMKSWWDPDNKRPVCERCAIALGFDKEIEDQK